MPPVGKSGAFRMPAISASEISGLASRASAASATLRRLCGGMLVAMPTAMPCEPFTSRFGKRAGSTDKDKVRDAMQATKAFTGVMGGVGAIYGFADGKRTGFDTNGMVVRVYEGDKQGKVVHVGAK